MDPLVSLEEAKGEKKTICRVCLNFDREMLEKGLSLFEKYEDIYVHEKINYIVNIEIKEDDGFPDRICSICLVALDNACIFKRQCESSNAILHSKQLQLGDILYEEYVDIPIKEEEDDYEIEYDYLEESYPPPETDTEVKQNSEELTEVEKLHKDSILDSEDLIKVEKQILPFKSKAIDLKLECHDCGGSFKSKCKLRVHWKKVHLPQQLVCPSCKKAHKTYKSLHSHMKSKSKACITASKVRVEGEGRPRIFHCKECDFKSNVISTMRNHLITHTGECTHMCELCKKAFKHSVGLMVHNENVHNKNVKKGTCKHCGKYIVGRYRWFSHMRTHKNGDQHCKQCGKTFASKEGLRVHMIRHTGVKSFACELCAKTFYTSGDLSSHKVSIHLKNRFYTCQQCNYKTLHCSSMTRHRSRHTGSNVPCEECGKFFQNKQQLVLHMERHVERTLKCSMCDKKYFRKKLLLSHVRKVHNYYVSMMGKDIKEEMT